MRKRNKIIIIVAAVLLTIFLSIGFYAGNMLYDLALNPNTDKSSVLNAPHNSMGDEDNIDIEKEREKRNNAWFKKYDHTEEYITSNDNLKLHAYKIINKQKTNKWVIIFHGYTSKAKNMTGTAENFYNLGYNVLIPDARGHGKSEGNYIGMGWDDRLDAVSWINEVTRKDKNAQIALYGISMGGATVMMASGEDLPDNVKVIVEDCGYSSVHEEFKYQLKALFGLPEFPVLNFADIVTQIRAGYSFKKADAVSQLEKSNIPILFIQGDSDTFVPSYMVDKVYKAAATKDKKKINVKGAGHGQASKVLGDKYWKEVNNFITKYLK